MRLRKYNPKKVHDADIETKTGDIIRGEFTKLRLDPVTCVFPYKVYYAYETDNLENCLMPADLGLGHYKEFLGTFITLVPIRTDSNGAIYFRFLDD